MGKTLKIHKGSAVRLPMSDLVGTVVAVRGRLVEVDWPGKGVHTHRRDNLIAVDRRTLRKTKHDREIVSRLLL